MINVDVYITPIIWNLIVGLVIIILVRAICSIIIGICYNDITNYQYKHFAFWIGIFEIIVIIVAVVS